MKGRRGFTLIELLVVIAIVAILAAILFPVFAKARQAAQKSNCESNMKQIGSAFKMYLQDWKDTYPTNRVAGAAAITADVTLTAANLLPARNNKGVNLSWVEALYPYMEPPSDLGNGKVDVGAWECRSASSGKYPTASATAYVTYAMNCWLCEQPEGIIKSSDRLMLGREMYTHVNSFLRPRNVTQMNATTEPQDAFLNGNDGQMFGVAGTGKNHGDGSHILFADSHVKWYPLTQMPRGDGAVGGPVAYDSIDSQWYNYVGTGSAAVRKTIAISP